MADRLLENLSKDAPWQQQFEKIASEIARDGRRTLLVVDDVDRLAGEELLALLRVIRLLGRFDDVHYLIAYDQNTVETLLDSAGRGGGSGSFMEKIVQLPFEVPPLPEVSAIRMLNETILELAAGLEIRFDKETSERAETLVGVLATQVKTPRNLYRFRHQLTVFAGHVNHAELDLLDFVAVTWLRLEHHGVWEKLPTWQADLLSGSRISDSLDIENISEQDWLNNVQAVVPPHRLEGAMRTLSFLAPRLRAQGVSSHSPHVRAFSDFHYFMRYLLLFLPDDDVSDLLVQTGIETLLQGDETSPDAQSLALLLDGAEPDRVRLAISKAKRIRERSTESSMSLVKFLAERLGRLDERVVSLGSKVSSWYEWTALEIGIAMERGVVPAAELVSLFQEERAIALAFRLSRIPRFRESARELLQDFAEYWVARIDDSLEAILTVPGRLGIIANLIIWTKGEQSVAGFLDRYATDLAVYQRIAAEFVRVHEWVGSDVRWEIGFRRNEFATAISPVVRARFTQDLSEPGDSVWYETDDLSSPDISPAVRQDFAVRSILELEKSSGTVADVSAEGGSAALA